MSRHIKYGFTIIELTLAMAFISVLLISIVLVSIQAGKMYNRGIILRGVNQAGRDIDTVMRQDFLQTENPLIRNLVRVIGNNQCRISWNLIFV